MAVRNLHASDPPSRAPLGRVHWVLLALLGAGFVAWGALYIGRTSFVVHGQRVHCLWDDGMISMHYARNLAEGAGLRWNAGQPAVQGFTNLGVTLVMAALHGLALPDHRVALAFQGLSLGLLVGVVALGFSWARQLSPAHPMVAVAAAASIMAGATLPVWALQGSDAGFVALWVMGSLVMFFRARRNRRTPWWTWVWFGAGLLLRADAALPYLVLWGLAVARGGGRGAAWRGLVIFVVVSTASVVFSRHYYGDWLPNTYHLKATGAPRGLVLGSGFAQLGHWLVGLVPALALAGYGGWRRRDEPTAVAAIALVGAWIGYTIWVGGDWAPQYGNRLLAPCLPVVAVLAAVALRPLTERALVDWGAPARQWSLVGVAVVVALVANPIDASREWFSVDVPTMFREYNERNYVRARYLRRFTDPDTVVGVHWAGVPIYFSRRPGLDVLGKSDRHIARLAVSRFAPGHSKWDWDYVLRDAAPDVILLASRGLRQRPDYRADYVTVLAGGVAMLTMRRDALHKLHDPDAVVQAIGEADAPVPPRSRLAD